ncbi:MAG: hypothetical protein LBE09_08295 [Christensenellaceae bacterium]|jgi:acetyl esterase/lipase|nr:hypothetical protein [Christensenellaceae bacterium]
MKTKLKVILLILIVLVFCLVLFACNEPNTNGRIDNGGTEEPLPEDEFDNTKMDYTVAYGSDPQQKMDIHLPHSLDKMTSDAYVAIFLGDDGMSETSTVKSDENIEALTDALIQNGSSRFTAVVVKYRTDKTVDNMLSDIRNAIKFLRDNRATYRVDLNKAGIMGYSFGGYLAMLYAYKETNSPIPIELVVGQSIFTDPTDPSFYPFSTDANAELSDEEEIIKQNRLALVSKLAGRSTDNPITMSDIADIIAKTGSVYDSLVEISPEKYFKTTSPMVHLYHGINDTLYDIQIVQNFATNRSTRVKLFEFNAGHDDLANDESKMEEATEALKNYMESVFIMS